MNLDFYLNIRVNENTLSSLSRIPFLHSHPPATSHCQVPAMHGVPAPGHTLPALPARPRMSSDAPSNPYSIGHRKDTFSFPPGNLGSLFQGGKPVPLLLCSETLMSSIRPHSFWKNQLNEDHSPQHMHRYGHPAWFLLLKVQPLWSRQFVF